MSTKNNVVFHIGLHKTGTSWMQEVYFKQHKQINLINNYLKPWKDEILLYLVKTPYGEFDINNFSTIVSERCTDKAKVNIVSAERLSGHPYSGAYDRYLIAGRIKRSFPNAKIIIFHREQVRLIQSVYKQLVEEGYTESFDKLLSNSCWKNPCFNLSIYKYDLMLQEYLKLFQRKQIGLFDHDEFRQNQDTIITEINHFLGVDYDHKLKKKYNIIVNESLSDGAIGLARLLNHSIRSDYHNPLINLRLGFIKIYLKNIKLTNNRLFSENSTEVLNEYYSESNQRFKILRK